MGAPSFSYFYINAAEASNVFFFFFLKRTWYPTPQKLCIAIARIAPSREMTRPSSIAQPVTPAVQAQFGGTCLARYSVTERRAAMASDRGGQLAVMSGSLRNRIAPRCGGRETCPGGIRPALSPRKQRRPGR